MLVECKNCGAPLDLDGQPMLVRCTYCKKTNQVRKLRKVAPQTPPAWKPPPVWSPPAHVPAPSTYQLKSSGRSKTVGPALVIGLVVPMLGAAIAAAVVFANLSGGGSSVVPSMTRELEGSIRETVVCGVDGKIEITDADIDISSGPLVKMGDGCSVVVKNSEGSAEQGFLLDDHGSIRIEGGSLAVEGDLVARDDSIPGVGLVSDVDFTAKDAELEAGGYGIQLGDDAVVKLTDVILSAKRDAVELADSSTLTIVGGRIESSGDKAVEVGDGAKAICKGEAKLTGDWAAAELSGGSLRVDSCTLTARKYGINVEREVKITVDGDSKVKGGERGIQGERQVRVRLDGGLVVSDGTGVHLDREATLSVAEKARVRGGKAGVVVDRQSEVTIAGEVAASGQTAVRGDRKVELTCKGGRLEGRVAVDLDRDSEARIGSCDLKGRVSLGRGSKRR